MLPLDTRVRIRLLVGNPGPDAEDLGLLGRYGVIVNLGTQWSEESYGVLLDGVPYPLAFRATELQVYRSVSC